MKARQGWVITLLAAGVIGLWAGSGYLLYDIPSDARGTFGDMFGAVNALFSGLAFLGVVYAILLQRQELILQRQELAATRQELARGAAAQEVSQAALRLQADVAALGVLNKVVEDLEKMHSHLTLIIDSAPRRISDTGSPELKEEFQKKAAQAQHDLQAINYRLKVFRGLQMMTMMKVEKACYPDGVDTYP